MFEHTRNAVVTETNNSVEYDYQEGPNEFLAQYGLTRTLKCITSDEGWTSMIITSNLPFDKVYLEYWGIADEPDTILGADESIEDALGISINEVDNSDLITIVF